MSDKLLDSRRVLARVKTMVQTHPDVVLRELLEHPFWPKEVEAGTAYTRVEDDTASVLAVVFSSADSDAWVEVISHLDPTEGGTALRFRMPLFGGGESPRTRQALLFLARAMQLDRAENPQTHRRRVDR